jgi:Ca2+-binding RTX toxin-like protein
MTDDEGGAAPAALNLLLRGQSNAIGLATLNEGIGAATLAAEVGRLLGFDPAAERVNIIFDQTWQDGTSSAIAGSAFLTQWITPLAGGWENGWRINFGSRQLIKLAQQELAGTDTPTAVVWLHNESDGWSWPERFHTTQKWISGVTFEAAALRAAAQRSAAEMPYVFVSAIPFREASFWADQAANNQTIRTAMEMLAGNAAFNAVIGARSTDLDQNADDPAQYGASHNSWQDGVTLALRLAAVIAEEFAHLARPGSPIALAGGNIASTGPQAIAAAIAHGRPDTVYVRLQHDVATTLQPLSDVAALAAGWSVRTAAGVAIAAEAAEIVGDAVLRLTFAEPLAAGQTLFYGWGNARAAIGNAPGQGNAIYDDAGLPVWVDPRGLALAQAPAPGTPASIIATNASAYAKGAGNAFTLPFAEPADGAPASQTWTAAAMGLRWTAPGAELSASLAEGTLEVRVLSGWSSIRGLMVTDDAPRITVAGAGNVAVTALNAQGAAITVEDVKSGLVRGGAGNDVISFTARSDAPNRPGAAGQADNQVTILSGSGDDVVVGRGWQGWTSFVIDAGAGNDVVLGGDGADTLRGNHGFDTITGGDGADRFVLRAANGRTGDLITDFDAAEGDRLVFEAVNPASVRWQAEAAGVRVQYDSADWLLLQGVATLDAGAVVFA